MAFRPTVRCFRFSTSDIVSVSSKDKGIGMDGQDGRVRFARSRITDSRSATCSSDNPSYTLHQSGSSSGEAAPLASGFFRLVAVGRYDLNDDLLVVLQLLAEHVLQHVPLIFFDISH